MKIAFAADYRSPFTENFLAALGEEMGRRGHEVLGESPPESIPPDVNVVINVTDARAPRANYSRADVSNFVCTVAETREPSENLEREAYGVLVKTMSNLLVYAVHREEGGASYLVTPELGFREVPHDGDHVRRVVDQVEGIADVTFMIGNDVAEDLPPELHGGDRLTEALGRAGRRLDGLGLLPSVLPLDEILSERDRRMLEKVFGVKQLSYGNVSVRRDRESFWMSGRGVDKSNLKVVGKDILLVTGADEGRRTVRVSVPPGHGATARVSVDAFEHYLVYRDFPGVGAIVHAHAWLPGIESTLQNYPCGSRELAYEVLELIRRQPDPDNAVVGLRNHGVTATGPDLETIFERVGDRLERQVPMV